MGRLRLLKKCGNYAEIALGLSGLLPYSAKSTLPLMIPLPLTAIPCVYPDLT